MSGDYDEEQWSVVSRVQDMLAATKCEPRHAHDCVALACHFAMLQRGFSFAGFGDSPAPAPAASSPDDGGAASSSPASPAAPADPPPGWNCDADVYSFKYTHARGAPGRTFLVKSLVLGPVLAMHAMDLAAPDRVLSVDVMVSSYVGSGSGATASGAASGSDDTGKNKGAAPTVFKDLDGLIIKFLSSVADKLVGASPIIPTGPRRDKEPGLTERRDGGDDDETGLWDDWTRGATGGGGFGFGAVNHRPTPFISGDDRRRHPLTSPEYGGNLIGPRHPGFGGGVGGIGRPPPGLGVPPGARYDPFGPPGVYPTPPQSGRGRGTGSAFGPDPDHLPPPGYDDMYM
ncbi:hypothetical protein Pelo_11446 [Pelomyxa schiedti]|nr:hypothetical protein Pelo_11446 [Pelomyxa schiedti]